MGLGFGLVLLRQRVQHQGSARGGLEARSTADNAEPCPCHRLKQTRDDGLEIRPVGRVRGQRHRDGVRSHDGLGAERRVVERAASQLQALAGGDSGDVARDTGHGVAAVEQFGGDVATGVAGDAEDNDCGHDTPSLWRHSDWSFERQVRPGPACALNLRRRGRLAEVRRRQKMVKTRQLAEIVRHSSDVAGETSDADDGARGLHELHGANLMLTALSAR
jgi:hypothetical protein